MFECKLCQTSNKGVSGSVSGAADTCQIRKVRAGGPPQLLERGVDLERLGEVLGANGPDVVAIDAAIGKGAECQRLLTLCQIRKVRACGGVLDGGQRRVDLERLGDGLDAFGTQVVDSDAASGVSKWGQGKVSAGVSGC